MDLTPAPTEGPQPAGQSNAAKREGLNRILAFLAFVLVLMAGTYFRTTGLLWGDFEYQHPDERFLIWVVADIAPVDSLGDYFDTRTSTLNPANRGHQFYVYGDLPVIATRYLTEWMTEQVGWEDITQAGRGLSALMDLLTTLLVFLTAERLFGWRVGLVAGLFSAASVLNIQQSHFFTTDTFATTFTMLAVYLAVVITEGKSLWRSSLMFGLAVGLGLACKINIFPVAVLLPLALLFAWLRLPKERRIGAILPFLLMAAAGGVVAFLSFRLAQPYAFEGPGFLNLRPDQAWVDSIMEQRAQASGDVDFPPSLQWARRPVWFSFINIVLWGLGFPLGVLSFAGLAWFVVRAVSLLFAGRAAGLKWRALLALPWPGTFIIWVWTAFHLVWQSLAWNPTMRYQLPIYPTLALMAGWLLYDLWHNPQPQLGFLKFRRPRSWRVGVGVLGGIVLLLTLAWGFAFSRIYNRTETRAEASRWILANVPGPVNLEMEGDGEQWRQMVPAGERYNLRSGSPYLSYFSNTQAGAPSAARLTSGTALGTGAPVPLRVRLYDPASPAVDLVAGEVLLADGPFENILVPLAGVSAAWPQLEPGRNYAIALEVAGGDGAGGLVELSGPVQLDLYGQAVEVELPAASGLADLRLEEAGTLREVRLPPSSGAIGQAEGPGSIQALNVLVQEPLSGEQQMSIATAIVNPATQAPTAVLRVEPPLSLKSGVDYLVSVSTVVPGEFLDPTQPVRYEILDEPLVQSLPAITHLARSGSPLFTAFTPQQSGQLNRVTLGHAVQVEPSAGPVTLSLTLSSSDNPAVALAQASLVLPPDLPDDPRGGEQTFVLNPPVRLEAGSTYTLAIEPDGAGAVAVRGSAPANETTWDMGLPFRMEGYDPFGGIYRGDLNFEMYWDDNADKYQRFVNILDQSDYIFISSNRQWGTTTRLPERHPLTTEYYRALVGCPAERDVIWCYNVAEEGTFQGQLGFDLVKVFTSYPNLGPVEFNTQFAEEAFTVYDHPKVFVFKKNENYATTRVQEILSTVDLEQVVRITPKKAADYKDLLLPQWRWAVQQAGGTWAELFPPEGLQNRYPWLGALLWYVTLLLLGWFVYPLVRLAAPGLPDRGYPLARIAGLLLLAWPLYMLGALGVPVTRVTVLVVFIGLGLVGGLLAFLQRGDLRREWPENRAYFLRVEAIALALFVIGLVIRLGNPDLWHPIFGGEKPMDLSYFNAVVKSTVFPPYDPWFAGGSLNYYYYGFVLVGMPLKLVGIAPQIGYNLILPALFAMVGLAAFSIVWNLAVSRTGIAPQAAEEGEQPATGEVNAPAAAYAHITGRAYRWGLAAVLALLLLGNLGTVRMFWQGWQKLMVSEEEMQQGNIFENIAWAGQGIVRWAQEGFGELPYYPGDWYWKPSRAIQPEAGNEITEFPFFTFLYADLHAHLIALPVTLLLIAWSVGVVLGRGCWGTSSGRYRSLSLGLGLFLGALAAGALRPTNTWDQYTYLPFAAIALAYSQICAWPGQPAIDLRRLVRGLLMAAGLAALALLLYRPFDIWFGQGYNALDLWKGNHTGLNSYLVHWGLFLFVIVAWVFDETVDWLAHTPLSAVNVLRDSVPIIAFGAGVLFVALVVMLLSGVIIALIAVPLGVWVALLLFRPGQPEAKRAVLFMIGTALLLTLAVEFVAVRGDIGRMNTVFKFYYQAWSLLSLSAAAALFWLWGKLSGWHPGWGRAWRVGLALLAVSAALYPFSATRAKWLDRMIPDAPRTLDGMTYMNYATYTDGYSDETLREMDLSEDYRAIRWMQANVPGSPVIVEAHTPEYRHWGTRYTIYTGLPGVVGWNWHQRQQRAITPESWVTTRIEEVENFYRTSSREQVEEFLARYNVGYVVVGQLERIWYAGPGLEKFTSWEGDLWEQVYADGETVIYRVRDQSAAEASTQ